MLGLTALFAIYLGSESIRFDTDLLPRFSEQQIRSTSPSTRAGLTKWAATSEGRAIISRMMRDEYEVTVIEDVREPAVGRAPQPSVATMIAYDDRKQIKRYTLVINPSLAAQYDHPAALKIGYPQSAVDVMASAWAAEMLHIHFYSRGIPLPHHPRSDFQERWSNVAGELGFPLMTHGENEDARHGDPVITMGRTPRRGSRAD